MKKKYIFLMLIFLSVFASVYYLTRRTPYSIAEKISGLEINRKNEVQHFVDEWGISGDGISIIVFILKDNDIASELSNQCIKKKYLNLPITEELPLSTIYNYINFEDSIGYYRLKLEDDGLSYNAVILDLTNSKLVVVNEEF
jgi:hypothetical protein